MWWQVPHRAGGQARLRYRGRDTHRAHAAACYIEERPGLCNPFGRQVLQSAQDVDGADGCFERLVSGPVVSETVDVEFDCPAAGMDSVERRRDQREFACPWFTCDQQ